MPELTIGWGYAWWFSAAYVLITISMVGIYGRTFSQRFFRLPKSESIRPRIPVLLGAALFGRVIMIYSIFVPLQLNTPWLWIGGFIFLGGAWLTAVAMINFATTPSDQPVRKGLYRFSRNPIQVLAIIMWIGVGIATLSWILWGACLLLAVVSYPSIRAQERFCLETYGAAYREYMKSTPRYFPFGKGLSKISY